MTAARIATMAKRRIPLRAKIVKPPAKAPASNALAYLSIDLLFVDMGIKKRRSQVRNPDAPHIYSLAVLFHPVNTVRGGTLGVNVTIETNPVGNFAGPADRTLNVSTYAQSSPGLIHD